jgi:ribosomal protein L24
MNPTKDSRLQVLKTHGIAGFVGNGTGPVPIPDQQIDDIRTVVARQIECTVIPILEEGDRVRVVRGPLVGVEGRLLQSNSMSRLLISIEMIQKSLTVSLSREDVELLDRSADRPVDKNPCWITPNQNSGMPTRLAHRVTELEVSCQDNSQNLPIK